MFRFRLRRFFNSKDLDYYELLGVMQNAKRLEIKGAYFKLAKIYHPDTPTGNTEKFKQINEAWSVLGDDQRRQEYDLNRKIERMGESWGIRGNKKEKEKDLSGGFNIFVKGTVKHELFRRVINLPFVQEMIEKNPWKVSVFGVVLVLALGIYFVLFSDEDKFQDDIDYGYFRNDSEILKRKREKSYFEDDYN